MVVGVELWTGRSSTGSPATGSPAAGNGSPAGMGGRASVSAFRADCKLCRAASKPSDVSVYEVHRSCQAPGTVLL